jgi:hypothetical protein
MSSFLTNTANVQLRELCPDVGIDSLLDVFSNVENLQQEQQAYYLTCQ